MSLAAWQNVTGSFLVHFWTLGTLEPETMSVNLCGPCVLVTSRWYISTFLRLASLSGDFIVVLLERDRVY